MLHLTYVHRSRRKLLVLDRSANVTVEKRYFFELERCTSRYVTMTLSLSGFIHVLLIQFYFGCNAGGQKYWRPLLS